jgi:hypothetical protein
MSQYLRPVLPQINSLTKYPSIPTYHLLDPTNGALIEKVGVEFTGRVIGTEKIDGCNARIIQIPGGDYLLGSREELLYFRNDLIGNMAHGIVDNLRQVADRLTPLNESAHCAVVYYLELYGGKNTTAAAKQYSGLGTYDWRVFDIATIDDLSVKTSWPLPKISSWRDAGGQSFATDEHMRNTCRIESMECVPVLLDLEADKLPTTRDGMYDLLVEHAAISVVALDDKAGGKAEGIVWRTEDRSAIAKVRFGDYKRTRRVDLINQAIRDRKSR